MEIFIGIVLSVLIFAGLCCVGYFILGPLVEKILLKKCTHKEKELSIYECSVFLARQENDTHYEDLKGLMEQAFKIEQKQKRKETEKSSEKRAKEVKAYLEEIIKGDC